MDSGKIKGSPFRRQADGADSPHSPLSGSNSPAPLSLTLKTTDLPLRHQPLIHAAGVDFPSSPTDSMLSPVSNSLKRKKFGGAQVNKKPTVKTCMSDLKELVLPIPIPTKAKIIIGSSSQNRLAITRALGWNVSVEFSNIDESIQSRDPLELPVLIAKAKDASLLDRPSLQGSDEKLLVTAESVCLFKGAIRERPTTAEEAVAYLSSYSNETLNIAHAIVVTHMPSRMQSTEVKMASVTFGEISASVVQKIVARGRAAKAHGAFTPDDADLYALMVRMEGGLDALLGLSVEALIRCIEDVSAQVAAAGIEDVVDSSSQQIP